MGKILDRISQFIENEHISIGAFERKINASKGVLSRAINNNTDIQAKWLEVIVENYPQLCAEWLLRGEGSMLKTSEKGVETASESGSNGTIEALKGIIKEQATEIATLRLMIQQMQAPPVGVQEAFTA